MTSLEKAAREALVALREARRAFNAAATALAEMGEVSSMEDSDILERRCEAVDQGYAGLLDEVAKMVGRERLGELVMAEMAAEQATGTD